MCGCISTVRARGKKRPSGRRAVGCGRDGNTSKLHLATDGEGNVLDWTRTAGQAGDCPEAEGLLRLWLAPAQEVVADAAYDRYALRELVARAGANAVIKPNAGRKNRPYFDPVAYAKRHHMEQIINKLKQFRPTATRYDKRDRSYEAFVCLRIITLYLN